MMAILKGMRWNLSVVFIRETPHITRKGSSQELSHVQKFNKQGGWPRKGKEKWHSSFSQRVWT
jgi:hypothetical protein